MAEVIAVDLQTVILEISKQGHIMVGKPVPGLMDFIRRAQDMGSTIFFISGAAHDPFMRQAYERLLESIGITRCFVTHGIPDGYDMFISNKCYFFRGEFPDLSVA